MLPWLGRLQSFLSRPRTSLMFGGFVDSLLQAFENCRAGLTDAQVAAGGAEVHEFFSRLYEQERPRLRDLVLGQETHLPPAQRQELLDRVDEMIRRVVIPAYTRLAAPFTRRERNDFYLTPPPLHGLERVAWATAGMLLGMFIVWAPFIPLWSKEWVLVFALGGLMFPNLRRFLALRGYQGELNRLVERTDAEIWRTDLGFLTAGGALTASTPETAGAPEDALREASPEAEEALRARMAQADDGPGQKAPRGKTIVREGGR